MHDSNSVSVPVHKRNEFTNDDLYGGNEPARTWYNAMGTDREQLRTHHATPAGPEICSRFGRGIRYPTWSG